MSGGERLITPDPPTRANSSPSSRATIAFPGAEKRTTVSRPERSDRSAFMAENTQPRRLTTIVAPDVAGYSARTEADEARTTAEVAALRSVIERIAGPRGGRVFNTAGDGFM